MALNAAFIFICMMLRTIAYVLLALENYKEFDIPIPVVYIQV